MTRSTQHSHGSRDARDHADRLLRWQGNNRLDDSIRRIVRPGLWLTVLLLWSNSVPVAGQSNDIPVFVLAGQSNMEGKGSIETLKRQVRNPSQAGRYQSLMRNGEFFPRDDVFITYLGSQGIRQGPLEPGYGTSKKNDRRLFGPELGFGWKLGDHFQPPVLIIKTAWGGKSLDCDFRPPSRGLPPSAESRFLRGRRDNPDLTRLQSDRAYGRYYREMIEHIQHVMNHAGDFPDQPGHLKLAGFVWFQGFNDQFAPTSVADYRENLAAFIRDVRRELQTPDLPFVIGVMGHGGRHQKGKIKQIADAQMAVAADASLSPVAAVATSAYWDEEADQAFQKYWADRQNRDIERWRNYGNDRPYHYHGSPKFFWDAGQGFGEAMIDLIDHQR